MYSGGVINWVDKSLNSYIENILFLDPAIVYLNKEVFSILLDILEKTLFKAIETDSLKVRNVVNHGSKNIIIFSK